MKIRKEDWWKRHFAKDCLLIEGFKWKVDIDFIEQALELPKGSRILDLACGYGRMSIGLAERGYDVLGLDYSKELLKIAHAEAIKRGVKVKFIRDDMRRMAYNNEFDGVLCWANSFGYFSDEENEKIMLLIARALKKRGKLLLDLHNKDSVIRNRLRRTWFKREKFYILEDWTFDPRLSRSIIRYVIINAETRKIREGIMSMREYTLPEVKRLLKDAGLEFIEVYGDTPEGFKPEGFGLDSSMQILAQKP